MITRWNDELYHHGVLGMRWGHRKQNPSSGIRKRGKEFKYNIRGSVYRPTGQTVKDARTVGGLTGATIGGTTGLIAGAPIGGIIARKIGADEQWGNIIGSLGGGAAGTAIGALAGYKSNRLTNRLIKNNLNVTLSENMTYGNAKGDAYGFTRSKR